MAIKKNKHRNVVTLTKHQWDLVEKACDKRGISKSKLIEFALREMGVFEED
jgi:hypothetical protein